jgi:carboxypeptidase C (cathepsin A)
VEAGFLEVPARNVTVKGTAVSIEATERLFYNLRPADENPESKPIFILFNGFADDIVRAYGTGPTTVTEGGNVVANSSSLTRLANLVYVEPRQAGYSYDVVSGRAPESADCSPDIFNEYVDAADMLFAVFAFLDAHPTLRGPVYWFGESYAVDASKTGYTVLVVEVRVRDDETWSPVQRWTLPAY